MLLLLLMMMMMMMMMVMMIMVVVLVVVVRFPLKCVSCAPTQDENLSQARIRTKKLFSFTATLILLCIYVEAPGFFFVCLFVLNLS